MAGEKYGKLQEGEVHEHKCKTLCKTFSCRQHNAVSDGPVLKPLLYSMHKEWTPVPATGISALNSKPSLSLKRCSCFLCAPVAVRSTAEKQKDYLEKGGDDEKIQEATSGSQSLA